MEGLKLGETLTLESDVEGDVERRGDGLSENSEAGDETERLRDGLELNILLGLGEERETLELW